MENRSDERPRNQATVRARAGKARFKAKVEATPAGLLAIGGLVSGILLSTAALVWVSASAARSRA